MKKVFFGAAVLALAAIGVFKATETNNYAFNDLQMENIEMLAQGEGGHPTYIEWLLYPCDNNPEAICYNQYNNTTNQGYHMKMFNR